MRLQRHGCDRNRSLKWTSAGAFAAVCPPQEGCGCHEGSVQGCELRLQREGAPGAIHGQFACRIGLSAVARVCFRRFQVRTTHVVGYERGFPREDLEDVWAE